MKKVILLIISCIAFSSLWAEKQMRVVKTDNSIETYKIDNIDKVESYEVQNEEINSHQYVDLGLSVLWATCNIGATNPWDFGTYFAWGETKEKNDYSWETYEYCDEDEKKLTKYCTDKKYGIVDNKVSLDKEDDAAIVNWGDEWRMPTQDELAELYKNCTRTFTYNYRNTGVAGFIFQSKIEGYTDKHIFMPSAGFKEGLKLTNDGPNAGWWASDLYPTFKTSTAIILFYYRLNTGMAGELRCNGWPIRPVSDKK